MSGYGNFAFFYDSLNSGADYENRGEYLWSLFKKHGGHTPKTCLDLACGTGILTEFFCKKGADMIGVDGSADMLSQARERLLGNFPETLLLCQEMTELDLYGTVEGGICTLDSLNHLGSIDEVATVFSRLKFFIEPGGLFIFDVNTPYKHKNILANNCFVLEDDRIYCGWQNFCDQSTLSVDIVLDIFLKQNGRYDRFHEEFSERAYEPQELSEVIEQNGFSVEAVYGDMTAEPPKPEEQRIVYVIKRKGM